MKLTEADRVRTTHGWADTHNGGRVITGAVVKIKAPGPLNPERTVLVGLDAPRGEFSRLWFAPRDLEPEVARAEA